MSYVTIADLAGLGRRKPRPYFVPAVTQRTSDEVFDAKASEAGEKAFGGMAFEAKAVEDAPIFEESGRGAFEPSDIDPGLGQLPLAAQPPASLGMLNTVATAMLVGAGVVLVGSWLMSTKEKKANSGTSAVDDLGPPMEFCSMCQKRLRGKIKRTPRTAFDPQGRAACSTCLPKIVAEEKARVEREAKLMARRAAEPQFNYLCSACGWKTTGHETSFEHCPKCDSRFTVNATAKANPAGLRALLSGIKGDSLGRSKMVSMIDSVLDSGALDAAAVRQLKRLRSKIADGDAVGGSEIVSVLNSIMG